MDSVPQLSKGRLRGCLYTWFRFPRTFYKLRITKLGLQIRRQNTWPVLPPKPKSTEINGVVIPRSFQMLVQWVCLGRIVFRKCTTDVAITTAIKFARLADMYGIICMESLMAEHIKAIILANPPLYDDEWMIGEGQTQILIASRPSTLLQQSLCLKGNQCVQY